MQSFLEQHFFLSSLKEPIVSRLPTIVQSNRVKMRESV